MLIQKGLKLPGSEYLRTMDSVGATVLLILGLEGIR
jgi:hypothetical protein